MTGDSFDKDLASLYQQRKAQVVAPKVVLEQPNAHAKYSPIKLLSIFMVAGSTSFAILAIISHLAQSPTTKQTPKFVKQNTELVQIAPKSIEEKTVVPVKPLPPKPEVESPTPQHTVKPVDESASRDINVEMFEAVSVKIITLPTLIKPQLIPAPTYKVLPEYPLNAAQTGEIELSYQLNSEGKVTNIKIVKSNVNRVLQRSAKKALSKWQYNSNAYSSESLQVRFAFKQPHE